MEKELKGQATAEQVAEWKKKYGEVIMLEVAGFVAYFRKPDMKIWRFCLKVIDKSQNDFKLAMARSCFIGGDKSLLESPYIEDVSTSVNDLIDYTEADFEKDGNGYKVTILDKCCTLKPVTVEMISMSERENVDDILFRSQQNLLKKMWIDGDAEILDEKYPEYHLPVLRVLKSVREKHSVSLKNV